MDDYKKQSKKAIATLKSWWEAFVYWLSIWQFGHLRIVFALYRKHGWFEAQWKRKTRFYYKGIGWRFVDYEESDARYLAEKAKQSTA